MTQPDWFRSISLACCLTFIGAAIAAPQQARRGGPDLPLEPASTISFTTDEGTWISLDVDPDGRSIVFELLGDLYELPIAGGTATRLTSGMAYDSQPRISPDGEWIAFVSDRDGNTNLWIARRDGSEPRKLSSGRQGAVISPAWTPDSDYVLVTQTGSRGSQVRMYHVDGGSGITVGEGDSGGGDGPGSGGGGSPARLGVQMSPDENYLYFAQSAGAGASGVARWQIARMDLRGGEVDVLTQAEGAGVRPQLSPDGSRLVYGTRYETQTGLRVRNLETGADHWVIWPVARDEIESGGSPSRDTLPGYAFTPDGDEIVVTTGGRIVRVNVDTGDVTPVPFTVDVALEVGPELEFPYRVPQGPVRASLVQSPAISPDGSKVAFSVLTKIYVMDAVAASTDNAIARDAAASGPSAGAGPAIAGSAPQTRPVRLTSGDAWEFKPAFSPDGQWIAYVTWSMEEGGHIWKTRADGSGQPQRLTTYPAFYTDVVFSPDGERIVGLRGNEYMRHQTFSEFGGLRIPLDLIWLPADGGDPQLVAPARGIGAPHFTDDTDRIYVYSNDGLISLRYDGTDRRTHLSVTGPGRAGSPRPPAADTVLMRPDGKWALASVNNQLWVVAVPPPAGDAPSVNVMSPSVPAERITDIGADYLGWADDGATIFWAIGSTVYRRPFDSIEFAPAGDEAEDETAEAPAEQAEEQDEPQEEGEQEEPFVPLDENEAVDALEVVLEFPRATPAGTIALRGATVITMAGGASGPVIENADVVVVDNRITAVGPRGQVSIPPEARQFDVSGKYIVPGFVDTHAHWEFRTHDVLEPQNWSLVANLAYGVTAGLDVQTSTNDYFAYRDLVETGQSIGERAFMTGPGIFSNNDFRSYEATLAFLERYKDHYRTPNIKSYMVGNRQQRQWVVQAAQELHLIPTTEGGHDMMMDITHAIDGMHGNEHTLPVFPLYKDVVELFAQTRTAYTPTLLVQYDGPIAEEYFFSRREVHDDAKLNRFYPHNRLDEMTQRRRMWARDEEFTFDEVAASAAKIQRAGGLVGVGGHGEVQGLGYHWEMWALASGGMTPAEVLQAATIDGARIIGFDADLGSIEEGKLADLVVLNANPLDDIENTNTIAWVMKNGELYDGDTLDQVWPVERPLPPFWWWDAEPPEHGGGR
ncbi:MAG: amidohydrolase family protein [Acidobacteriota bacterium]|jgi:Tol biopolymer transport system component